MSKKKTVEEIYQELDEIEHVRRRIGIYAGSAARHDLECYVVDGDSFAKKAHTAIPAFLKIFDEILSNACDEAKRNPDVLDTIQIQINKLTGEIIVEDNGTGIPVVVHKDNGKYIPEMIFGSLRAGSNFSDHEDASLIGTNGVGSTICAILSTSFTVETADGKKAYKQTFSNGLRDKTEPAIRSSLRRFTRIRYTPDYAYFNMAGLDDSHFHLMEKMVYDAAACTPNVTFTFNGKKVNFTVFSDYVSMYAPTHVFEESEDWKIAVSPNPDGYEQISFVNGVNTYNGGTHVDYITNQICNRVREFLKSKHKIDVKPADVKAHMRVFVSARINRPRFSSQTKENMVSPVSDWKTSHTVSDKFIAQVTKSELVQSIIDWVEARDQAKQRAEERDANKNKVSIKTIPKFHDATTTNRSQAVLFLAEGDSSLGGILGCRDAKLQGVFPLKGRPINVCAKSMKEVRANEEFERVRNIIGLKYGEPAVIEKLNFGKIVIASDQDLFGASIAGLVLNMFYRLWPELVENGIIYRLLTPIVIVGKGKKAKEFFTMQEFEDWRAANPDNKESYRFLKGLGSNTSEQFKKYLADDKYLIQFQHCGDDTAQMLDLCFKKEKGRADDRKAWLAIEASDNQ